MIPFPKREPDAPPKLFVSIFAYVLGKETDDPAAVVEKEIELGERATWPAFRALARIREQVYPIQLHVTHSSLIARARSLALGAFLESAAPRCISIDDDVEASSVDLGKLLGAEDVDVLLAPCTLRGAQPPQLNVLVEPGRRARVRVTGGVRVFEVMYGGFALSTMTRLAAQRLYDDYEELRFIDARQGPGLGVFLEQVKSGMWWGEDHSCCTRARASGLRVEALCDAAVTHAGVLATVDPRVFQSDKLES